MGKFEGPYQLGEILDISPEPEQDIYEFRVLIQDANGREVGATYGYTTEEALAIARLFAAAPAMYDYLRKAARRSTAAAEIVKQIEQGTAPQTQKLLS